MSNNVLELYGKKCKDLISSMVIKSGITAERVNNEIVVRHSTEDFYIPNIDPYSPRTWRYYMNVAGLYHAEDTIMRVVSLDTTDLIDFTVENLKIHKATARAYAVGQPKYKELLQQYPKQSNLIRGILNPCNIDEAIKAEDGKILAYDKTLVEENEYDLIPRLQEEIYAILNQYNVAGYNIVSDLFPAQLYALLAMRLVTKVMTIRLGNCNTNQAHSFHVGQYLISNGFKNSEIAAMTLWQRLYLYRNIRYLRINQGQQKTFKKSMDAMLTQRDIPLAEYQMHHDISVMPNQLTPSIVYKTRALNATIRSMNVETITTEQLLTREDTLAVNNPDVKAETVPIAVQQMQKATTGNVLTKALQSTVYDETNSGEFRLADVMLSHLIDWTDLGIYKSVINIVHPVTGETVTLSGQDAIVLMLFCQNKLAGGKSNVIPAIQATRVQRLTGYDQRSL